MSSPIVLATILKCDRRADQQSSWLLELDYEQSRRLEAGHSVDFAEIDLSFLSQTYFRSILSPISKCLGGIEIDTWVLINTVKSRAIST